MIALLMYSYSKAYTTSYVSMKQKSLSLEYFAL